MPGAARPSNVRRDRGRGASSGTDSGGKGSASETGGKGTVRRLGRNQSPHSESSTPSLMPPVPPAAQMWSTDESSFDEAGEDRYLFGESRVSGYMKRRRASRAEGPREAPAAPSPSACASLPATSSSAGAESPGRHAPKSPSATRGSLLESLSEGVASIWPRGERSSPRSPSRDSFQSTVLVTKDGEPPPQEGLKDLIEETAEDREAAGSPQAQAKRSSFLAAELAQSLKRLSSDLSAGVVSMADALRAAPAPEASWTGARDHDTEASASSSADRSLNLDALMNEAHLPFRQLLQEVPDPENTPGGILASFPRLRNLQTQESRDDAEHSLPGDDASASASSLHFGAQSPLFSAVVRARLAAHLIGCYESVTGELSGEEIQLWDVFVRTDHKLAGALTVSLETADDICDSLAAISTRAHGEACVRALGERVDESAECDFADLLDVWESERPEQLWLRSSIRTGLSNLLAGAGLAEPLTVSRVPDLRARCARLSDLGLAVSAAAYQRTLVLTCSWHCEQRLKSFLSQKDSRGREVKALLAVLRGIHSELVPTERVLWELMGKREKNFDGSVSKKEVLDALEDLLGFHEEDARASPGELEELDRLRRQCQQRSVDNLFGSGRRQVVAFADVLRWWWDMPEEYREAAGLAVPASVLRQRMRRQPEEMFRTALRRVAAEPAFARQALRGHVRAFAELRALAVRRSIESFSIRSTAESRTTTSDAGDVSVYSADAEPDADEAISPHSPQGASGSDAQ